MISVSGKNWEEEKFNKRLIEKIKINHNFDELMSRQILSKQFDEEEIYSLNNQINLSNPFINKADFKKAVKILDNSINNKENICIIGDYDVDGCISTSLLVKFLKKINAKYFYYIPNRFTDGYGSSVKLMKKISIKKPNLVIMVDNGSTSHQAINYLIKKNIKSIIIDHHEIYHPYPKSDALINPKKKSDYSNFDYLCSAVLTYFFIDTYLKEKKIKLNFSENLHLVLLSIVSDIMPLRKINRVIACKVLKNQNIYQEYFFKKVFDFMKIKKNIEIDDFGFLFGPIINSAGRLDDPNIIVQLFTTNNNFLKDKIIKKIILLNEKRKIIQNNIFNQINLNKITNDKKPVVILENNNINEGLIGLIASNIKNYFNKPTIVITKSNNIYKGSGRSTKNFELGNYIKKALDTNLLETGGGHNFAAGFTIKKNNLLRFKNFIYINAKKTKFSYDNKYLLKLSLSALNKSFLSELDKFQPYGEENINPYFLIENIKIVKTKIIKNKFISCFVKNRSGKLMPAISFNFLGSNLSNNILNNKNEVNIVVQVKTNFWNNKKSIQVIIIDLLNTSIKT